MAKLIVQHPVADYDAWRVVFDEHGTSRREHGCTSERVYRATDDANSTLIIMDYPSVDAIEGFLADPSLREAMDRAGVTAAPTITIADVAVAAVAH